MEDGGLLRRHGDRREAEEGVERLVDAVRRHRRTHPPSGVGGIARRRIRVEKDGHDRLTTGEHRLERRADRARAQEAVEDGPHGARPDVIRVRIFVGLDGGEEHGEGGAVEEVREDGIDSHGPALLLAENEEGEGGPPGGLAAHELADVRGGDVLEAQDDLERV